MHINNNLITTKLEIREMSENFTKFSGKLKFLVLKKLYLICVYINMYTSTQFWNTANLIKRK